MTDVELLHKEIDEAEDLLLQYSLNELRTHNIEDEDYINDLKELGFTNVKSVVEADRKIKNSAKSKELYHTITYYKEQYPFLKFLTNEKFEEICDKWGLHYASVKYYIGDVPKKNLEEIKNAQPLDEKDKTTFFRVTSMDPYYDGDKKNKNKLKEEEKLRRELISWIMDQRFFGGEDLSWRDSDFIIEYTKKTGKYVDPEFFIYEDEYEMLEFESTDLFIAAPRDQFVSDLDVNGNALGVSKKIVNDPIVFRYVKGGLQILTKWGAEGEDTNLTNDISN